MEHKDLTGHVFGRWTVLREGAQIKQKNNSVRAWVCKCECGTIRNVREQSLIQGTSKSCGCYHSDIMRDVGKVNKTHGMSTSRLYRIYCHMCRRCTDQHDARYKHYGARGITVCDEWNTFDAFKDWALSSGYSDNLSIDRIDVNMGYSPDNCRWSTIVEQANNKTSTIMLEYDGEKMSLAQWAAKMDMPYKKLWKRIHSGWDIERALTT